MMKDNKLIAEFMGLEFSKGEYYRPLYNSGDWIPQDELHYHTSWDWLIPVVEKIEMECEGVPLQLLNCNLYSEIGEVYQAVVEFIKIYNESNKMDTLPPSVQQG